MIPSGLDFLMELNRERRKGRTKHSREEGRKRDEAAGLQNGDKDCEGHGG